MSHLTKVKTKMNDPEKMERALTWLGFTFKTDAEINTFNKVPKCEFVITNAGHWNVGLTRDTEGVYEIFGDSVSWGGMQSHPKMKKALSKASGDKRRDVFAGVLAQAYAITTAMYEATKQGHEIYVSDPDEDGIIRAQVVIV